MTVSESVTDAVEFRITVNETLPNDPQASDGLTKPDDRPASDANSEGDSGGQEQSGGGGQSGDGGESGGEQQSGESEQGGGGGQDFYATAGGKNPAGIAKAIEKLVSFVENAVG